jgi:23S rRNA (uracil1939-C5)-methyltransferase
LAVLQPHQNLVGVEGNAAATGMATHNTQQQGLAGQASFVATSVDKWVAGDGAHQQVDVAIVDPPRAGLGKGVSERLATVPSQGVIYLSCDPATMSRDIKYLTASGLTLKTIMPVDFFPHTHHVEALALLVCD